MMTESIQENWDLLRAAVVLQACQDYAEMLKHPGKRMKVKYDPLRQKWVMDDEVSICRWFHSKQFRQLWCDNADGEAILCQMRENHQHGRRFYSPFSIGSCGGNLVGRVCG